MQKNERVLWRNLYKNVVNEVVLREGRQEASLEKYRNEYRKEFAQRWLASSSHKLTISLKKSQVILLGDFHAYVQSQKNFIRLLNRIVALGLKTQSLGVAIECVQYKDQKYLDLYMSNQMSEAHFLNKIQWDKWGFSWKNYKIIFDWCRSYKIKLYAINFESKNLKTRDLQMAQYLKASLSHLQSKSEMNARLVVLVGEWHLAQPHLPLQLRRQEIENQTVIFQNPDELAMRHFNYQKKEVVYSSKNSIFATINSPPWVKWQEYLIWLNSEDGLDEGSGSDMTDEVGRHVQHLCKLLHIDISLNHLNVASSKDKTIWRFLEKQKNKPSLLRALKWFIRNEKSFFMSTQTISYLARPTFNHISHLAMQYVHSELCGGTHVDFHFPRCLQRVVWIEALAYFGSKLLNPMRKSKSLRDLIQETNGKTKHEKIETMRIVLTLLSGKKTTKPSQGINLYLSACVLSGRILGENMWLKASRNKIDLSDVRSFMQIPFNQDFDQSFDELRRKILKD